jgi:mitogen-activated protein kinase kinase kinase
MYSNTQRDPSRPPIQVPPPPPLNPGQLNTVMNLPPPPPRYPFAPSTTSSAVLLPPPPGPPPGSALGQQTAWHGSWGRTYDPRTGFPIPPPPPGGQHATYNPQLHAQASSSNLQIPPPPPQTSELGGGSMSATYIPGRDTYGEGVGIPGFGDYESSSATYTTDNTWSHPSYNSNADTASSVLSK